MQNIKLAHVLQINTKHVVLKVPKASEVLTVLYVPFMTVVALFYGFVSR
jgi:hypothetical protein